MVLGQNWIPYQALNVVTPAFPEYVSGHSTFTAAGATMLAAFTGSNTFGVSVTIPADSSKIESGTPAPGDDPLVATSRPRPTTPAYRAATAASTSSPATTTAGGWAGRSPSWCGVRPRTTSRGTSASPGGRRKSSGGRRRPPLCPRELSVHDNDGDRPLGMGLHQPGSWLLSSPP